MGSSGLSVEAAPLFLLPQFHLLFTLADTPPFSPSALPLWVQFLLPSPYPPHIVYHLRMGTRPG